MREILLVEDSDADAEFIRRALKTAKVVNPVRHARDGAEAMSGLRDLERRAAGDPAVIPCVLLLDLNLPSVNGFEILTHLQGRAAFSTMLKVMVSDSSDMARIRKAYALGAQ